MSELIPFSRVDDYNPENYTEAQLEAASFLSKMDWEGGIDGLIGYGGYTYFPEELQELAKTYEQASKELRRAIDKWAADRGVSY